MPTASARCSSRSTSHRPLIDGPAPSGPVNGRRDHVGVHLQRDGHLYVGAAPVVGRLSGSRLTALADLAEAAGSGRVALTAEQKVVILDVIPIRVDDLADGLNAIGLKVDDVSPFRRNTMACTGVEYCKLAIVETKARAADLIDQLEARLPEYNLPLAVHVNGCPNSCARIQVADIGLKGIRALDADGNDVEGFQVHLGGRLGEEAGFGRTVKGLRLPADDLPDYIERLLRTYVEEHEDGESFSAVGRPCRRRRCCHEPQAPARAIHGRRAARARARRPATTSSGAKAEDIIRWAAETFGDHVLISQSMANTALAHLVHRYAPEHPRGLPRHRLPLRGDPRHARRPRAPNRADDPEHHAAADRRRAGRGVRAGPVEP